MTYVTLTQAAKRIVHRLTFEPVPLRTLQKWVQRHPEIAEKRVVRGRHQPHYLEEADLLALLAYYPDYELLPDESASAPMRTLALKIHELEGAIGKLRALILAELEQRKHEPQSSLPRQSGFEVPDEETQNVGRQRRGMRHERRYERKPIPPLDHQAGDGRPPPLPAGWVSYSAICRDHHVDKRTVDHFIPQLFGIESREVAHRGPYRLPNTHVSWALDEEQQRWILAVFAAYEHFRGYRECRNPVCPCHAVDIALASAPPPITREHPMPKQKEQDDGESGSPGHEGD